MRFSLWWRLEITHDVGKHGVMLPMHIEKESKIRMTCCCLSNCSKYMEVIAWINRQARGVLCLLAALSMDQWTNESIIEFSFYRHCQHDYYYYNNLSSSLTSYSLLHLFVYLISHKNGVSIHRTIILTRSSYWFVRLLLFFQWSSPFFSICE